MLSMVSTPICLNGTKERSMTSLDDIKQYLPPWAEVREYQLQAIEEAIDGFQSNCSHVFLDAPTGSGKTLLGYLVAKVLGLRCIYLCTSLSLQDQFHKDFPEASILKGRSNYPTLNHP